MITQCPHCGQKTNAPDAYVGRPIRCPSCQTAFVAAPLVPFPPSDAPADPAPPPPPSNTPADRRPTDGFGLAALGLLVAALTLAACLIVIADGRTPDPAAVMIGLVGGLGLFGAGLIVWSLGQILWKLDQIRRDIAQK